MRHRRELQQLTIEGGYEVAASLDLSPSWGGARPGAGRPKGSEPTRTISIRVKESLYNYLASRAANSHQSIGQYLVALIEECELG